MTCPNNSVTSPLCYKQCLATSASFLGDIRRSYMGLSRCCMTYVRARSSPIRLSDCINVRSLESAEHITHSVYRCILQQRMTTTTAETNRETAGRARPASQPHRPQALNLVNFVRRRQPYITRCNMTAHRPTSSSLVSFNEHNL